MRSKTAIKTPTLQPNDRNMGRLLSAIAGLVAICVMLLIPGVYSVVRYQSDQNILKTETEINARLVTQLINFNPELWHLETSRLEVLLARRPSNKTPENRLVLDMKGNVVAAVQDGLTEPLYEKSMPVYDAGQAVGSIIIQRSQSSMIANTAWIALLGTLLAAIVFLTLKFIPMRALQRAQDALLYDATHDSLTGLPNRILFHDRLEQAMSRAQRTHKPLALIFMDLDKFKDINDSLGHDAGDKMLRHVAHCLNRSLQNASGSISLEQELTFSIARLGGDEFTAIIEGLTGVEDASEIADHIQRALIAPVRIMGRHFSISGSIGIAMYPNGDIDLDTLVRQADMAMYRAKELGRNTYHVYNDELNVAVQERIELERSLRGALERGEFVLHYQPKADIQSGEVTGVEALLRWKRPGRGLILPEGFIASLEESGLIVPVGAWVIATASEQLAAWDRSGLRVPSMAVNLSARQFREANLTEEIANTLRHNRISPHRFELELTESLLMEDNDLSREILSGFADIGVRVAIDDFGTGHSSLAYLKRFRVDTLKIDRTFMRELPHDADNCAISTAVTALAQSMNLSVVCEGVENREQLAFLRTLGCDAFQGFLLAHPMPADALSDWLNQYVAGDGLSESWRQLQFFAPEPPALRSLPAVSAEKQTYDELV